MAKLWANDDVWIAKLKRNLQYGSYDKPESIHSSRLLFQALLILYPLFINTAISASLFLAMLTPQTKNRSCKTMV